jgi:diaminopimelate decarboxylase
VLTGHEGSKFGLAPAAAAVLIARIEHSPRLRMRGLHVHVGSQILEVEPFAQSVAPLAALGAFEVYDLGGGLGARYTYADRPPGIAEYLDARVGAARAHLPPGAELIVEPGRSMVATTATTLYRVITVKRGTVTFVAVDGGIGDNLEVALVGQRFEAGIPGRFDGADTEVVTVVGHRCESGDVLVDAIALPSQRQPPLPVVFADGGQARLVVRRESWADLLARDVD